VRVAAVGALRLGMAEKSSDGTDSSDENKRKFREALERKKANAGGGSEHKDGGRKHGPRSTGPAESRREFRRKSV
jgi:uncharacterized protein DUF5302